MTNQSTKYRKFLAGAASATLVATAIVPTVLAEEVETAAADFSDVAASHTHYAAIMQAVERGLFDGYKDGTFKPENSIDRKGVVKSLAKYVISQSEHKTFEAYIAANKLAETVAPFNDVPATHGDAELFNASLIVKDSGIFRGSNNNLMPANNITRQQMAQVLVKGFGLKDLADVESTVTDTDKAQDQYVDFINILSENGVTAVTTFNPTTDVKRGQMASFLNRSFDVAHPEEVNETPEVVSVSAVNATSVKLTGTNLDALTAEDFSLEGNKVTSYNVDAESGVASLTLEKSLESAKEQTLTLTEKVEGEADDKVSEFKFTYTLEITSVTANALTVDDDTAGQKLTFKINDESVDADVEYINASGYTVEFQSTGAVFVGSVSNSNTGELAATLTNGFAYKVVVTDKDGNVVAESELSQVKVEDKSSAVAAIDSMDITNGAIKLASNTIVLGERFSINNIVGDKADGTKDTDVTSLVEFDSSNKNVAIVDSTGAILPITAGKTTITVKSGNVAKTFELTVATEDRTAKTATATSSSLKLVEGGADGSVGLVVKDQYGDVVNGLVSSNVSYETTKVTVDGVATDIVDVTAGNTDAEGKATLTVTPAAAGSGTVKVKVGDNVIATLSVSVSKDINVSTRKLELVDANKDANLDIYAAEVVDNGVEFVYNQYNDAGYLLGKETTDLGTTGTKYTVSVEEATGKDIIDASVTSGVITVTAKAHSGTAYLVIKEGSVVREKKAITVVNSTPTVTTVNVKTADKVTVATNVTASSVLTLKTETGKNSLVQDITLTSASKFAVRLDETTGKLYLDADNDGAYDEAVLAGDVVTTPAELVVGTVSITKNIQGTTTGTTVATQAGDKGSVVYSVKDASGKVIATSVVNVEVPAPAAN